MTVPTALPFSATVAQYQQQADALLAALHSGDAAAGWRFKWEHPRFRDKGIAAVQAATLDVADAQLVVARGYGFEDWAGLVAFADAVNRPGPEQEFERAVEAVVDGDTAALQRMLQANPALARARSARGHRATLLHYTAANGVENARQRTPANAVAIARMLLDAGAEADALAGMYDEQCTTMSMLVSSSHPAQAGVQIPLVETLLDYGAALTGAGSKWHSALLTALTFGYIDTAEALVRRGAAVDNLIVAAGLGRLDDAARMLPHADAHDRHAALALAAQHGHADVVKLLLDAGEDLNRYNPDGFHSHATPLHQAIWSNHMDVVRLLVERGARQDIRDTIFQSTPLGWAEYGERTEIAGYLRMHGGIPA